MTFAESCKIPEQAALKMIQRIVSLEERFKEAVGKSFLTEEEKAAFVELMSERMERIR